MLIFLTLPSWINSCTFFNSASPVTAKDSFSGMGGVCTKVTILRTGLFHNRSLLCSTAAQPVFLPP
jgi:hypothetical protein